MYADVPHFHGDGHVGGVPALDAEVCGAVGMFVDIAAVAADAGEQEKFEGEETGDRGDCPEGPVAAFEADCGVIGFRDEGTSLPGTVD